jgi:DHA3 family multidrug efflux protein-like MFS transporter
MSSGSNKRTFYSLLANTLLASVTNFFVWFAVTFWVYIETQSILATSLIAGIFAVINAVTALNFGAIVDHNKKKVVMVYSSLISLVVYILAGVVYLSGSEALFKDPTSWTLWLFIIVLMIGSIVGNLRTIAVVPCVTILFNEDERAKANGEVGIVSGISFGITSVLSGLVIGFAGMGVAVVLAIIMTVVALLHMLSISLPEKEIVHLENSGQGKLDIRGTLKLLRETPGLFAFIIFSTFNNLLGGIFMALMDAYGLSLMSVQAWGMLFGFMSFAFIGGGILVSKFGLGKSPVRTFFFVNIVIWTSCILFTIQPWIWLLIVGMFTWMFCAPIVEACESTVIQKVVPLERQGRVVGFGQSLESAVMPLTTFLIGPMTHFFVVPFMTTGLGAVLIGSWFGTGQARAIALVFTVAGVIGLIVTLFAMNSKAAKYLTEKYQK